jgi:hypothetical protein
MHCAISYLVCHLHLLHCCLYDGGVYDDDDDVNDASLPVGELLHTRYVLGDLSQKINTLKMVTVELRTQYVHAI